MVQWSEWGDIIRMDKLIIGSLCLLISGCGLLPKDSKVEYTDKDLRAPIDKNVSTADKNRSDIEFQHFISETALSASKSIQSLSALEHAAKPEVKKKPAPNPIKTGLDQRVTIEWTGPVEPVLEKLAKNAHYRVNLLGQPPVAPILVSVNRSDAYLADVIQDIAYQVQRFADVSVNASEKLIELRYNR